MLLEDIFSKSIAIIELSEDKLKRYSGKKTLRTAN